MPPYNAPSWKKFVKHLVDESEFGPPADVDRLTAVEKSLGVTFPLDLRDFLLEADGLIAGYNSIIWPVADIEQRNREFRTFPDFRSLYMPFDHLLFFADDGGGDQFAFAIDADGEIRKSDIYCWEHESDARSWFAGHLSPYVEQRLKPQ